MPAHILVVDDEPDLSSLIEQRFRKHIKAKEFYFSFAADGVEALDILKQGRRIDVVLTDINMPRMDGLTLLSEINELFPDLRPVIISAYGDMKNIRTALNRGAFDFITKPIDFEDLEITINKTLREVGQMRQAMDDRNRVLSFENELKVARDIQRRMLPPVRPEFHDKPHFAIEASMKPARAVGGDFYDFFMVEKEKLGFCIGDVSGKGVPAALFMVLCKSLLKAHAITGMDPGKCLRSVNNILHQQSDPAVFVTLIYGILDLTNGQLTFCNGGHNPFYIVSTNGELREIPANGGIPLSFLPDFSYASGTIALEPGQTVFFYTDGVNEAMDEEENEFSEQRLEESLSKAETKSPEKLIHDLQEQIEQFTRGTEQSDDITMLAVQYKD